MNTQHQNGQQRRPQPNQNLPMPAQESALALPGGRAFMPSDAQWKQIKEMGISAFKSGMIPKSIGSAEAAAIIGLKAYELGVPLMEGFAHIHVINGKPTISRELMQSLVTQNIPGSVIDTVESTATKCTVEGRRPGRKPMQWTFTIEEAKTAGLLNKDPWKHYPKAMLFNRAVSALCRAYFPDGLRGCSYTAEELEPVTFETTGTLIEGSPVEPVKAAAAPEVLPAAEEPKRDEAAIKDDQSQRLAQLSSLVDSAKWPQGTISKYAFDTFGTSRIGELKDYQWQLLLNVVKNSDAITALGEFNASPEIRVQ